MQKYKRVVVKVGTSSLTYSSGQLSIQNMERLVRVLSDIRNRGHEVVFVSSAAITAGMAKLGFRERPTEVRLKQAAAAVGQGAIFYLYEKFFAEYGLTVGQILLNKDDVALPNRRQNLENTFLTLLELGCVPIVNENDSVAVDEIIIGDNDTLSAEVALLVEADALILLTDTDGLFDADPRGNPDARLISTVEDIESVAHLAGGAGTDRGTGGMQTKIQAARIATAAGIDTFVVNGADPKILFDILDGRKRGTLFKGKSPDA